MSLRTRLTDWWESDGVWWCGVLSTLNSVLGAVLGVAGLVKPERLPIFLGINAGLNTLTTKLGAAIKASPTNSTTKDA